MSPARCRHGSWTEIRLGARAHPTRTTDRAHAPPPAPAFKHRSRTDARLRQVPAQIRSVAPPRAKPCPPGVRFSGGEKGRGHDRARGGHAQALAHVRRGRRDDRRAAGRARRSRSASAGSPRRWVGRASSTEERVWALEDCRHVSGAFERFLLVRGERVVRVATRLMAGARDGARDARQVRSDRRARGRSRRAARRGSRRLPTAQLGRRRARHPVAGRSPRAARPDRAWRSTATLRWHLHDLWPERRSRPARCSSKKWHDRIGRRLARAEQTAQGPDRPRRAAPTCASSRRTIDALESRDRRPRRPGRAAAARRARLRPADRGQADRRDRRRRALRQLTPSSLAPAVSPRSPSARAQTDRHRLDRGGNRQLNTAIHRVAVTRARCHPETAAYIARKRAEGKTRPRSTP